MEVSLQTLLFVAAAVFTAFLVWKYRPRLPFAWMPRKVRRAPTKSPEVADGLVSGRSSPADAEIRGAREKARHAKTPRERAASLVVAAEAAAGVEGNHTAAMGLYLRAMRADATFCDPIQGIAALLREDRPELLETVLWRRLAHLSWSGDTRPAVRCTVETLITLYRRELRHRDRARALHKLVTLLQ